MKVKVRVIDETKRTTTESRRYLGIITLHVNQVLPQDLTSLTISYSYNPDLLLNYYETGIEVKGQLMSPRLSPTH